MSDWLKDYSSPIIMLFVLVVVFALAFAALGQRTRERAENSLQSTVVNIAKGYELLVTWQEDGVQHEVHIRLVPISGKEK